jgi:hypothetical protein
MTLEDSPMARTSEATTRKTRGAGSVYWTRPRSIIGARAVEGLVCWLSCYTYTRGSDGMTVEEKGRTVPSSFSRGFSWSYGEGSNPS